MAVNGDKSHHPSQSCSQFGGGISESSLADSGSEKFLFMVDLIPTFGIQKMFRRNFEASSENTVVRVSKFRDEP